MVVCSGGDGSQEAPEGHPAAAASGPDPEGQELRVLPPRRPTSRLHFLSLSPGWSASVQKPRKNFYRSFSLILAQTLLSIRIQM